MSNPEINTIINGDCFDVLKEYPDDFFDAVITDPPYGVLKHRIETNIDINKLMLLVKKILKQNTFFIYFGQQPSFTKWNASAFEYFTYKNEVIWYKRMASSFLNDMLRVFENIMIVCKGTKRFNKIKRPYNDVKESLAEFFEVNGYKRDLTRFIEFIRKEDNYINFKKYYESKEYSFFIEKLPRTYNNEGVTMSSKTSGVDKGFGTAKIFFEGYNPQNLLAFKPHNVKKFNKEDFNIKHPTVKPIELIKYLIELTTPENGIVLDPFAGSFTTAIACLETGRRYVCIEKEKDYFEIGKNRIEQWHLDKKLEVNKDRQLELDVL